MQTAACPEITVIISMESHPLAGLGEGISPIHSSEHSTGSSICIQDLQRLADQGSWRALAENTSSKSEATGTAKNAITIHPLTIAAYNALSLARLRDLPALAALLKRVDPNKASWPFVLHWSSAILLAQQGKQIEAIDQFITLYHYSSRPLQSPQGDGVSSAGVSEVPVLTTAEFESDSGAEDGKAWSRRGVIVACTLAGLHARMKDYMGALQWMQRALRYWPHEGHLISQAGLLLAAIGDIEGAQAMFIKADRSPQATTVMTRQHAGILLFAQHEYQAALVEFEVSAAADVTNAAAANNASVCRIYANQGARAAVEKLENAMKGSSLVLTEPSAASLMSLYSLAARAKATSAKQALAAWAVTAAPQDFDFNCLN